jgi:excisionase family DNA binding protein
VSIGKEVNTMQKIDKQEQYLSMKEAKEYTTLSYNALKKAVKQGDLESVFVNSRYLFKLKWLDAWLGGWK